MVRQTQAVGLTDRSHRFHLRLGLATSSSECFSCVNNEVRIN